MQVKVESTGTLERKMRVELPAERIEKEVESRLKRVGKTAKIKGFRPGKVPAQIVRQHYGGRIRQEVLSEVMGQSYRDAVQQENLNPVAQPRIEPDPSAGSGLFAYTATFEVLPDVKLGKLDRIEVTVPEVEISESDCDDMIENLREQKATWHEVDRAAQEGDRIIVDFEGKLDGEAFKGGSGKDVKVVLGAGQMLADFEKALLGARPGEEKSAKVRFPKDYHADELAGKKVMFDISVGVVEEKKLPPLDDSLAETYGVEVGGLEQLRRDVRDNMQREAAQKIRGDIRDQALSGLLDANPLEVPKALVYQEAHSIQHEWMHRFGVKEHDKAPAIDNFLGEAERRVRLSLLVRQLIDDNDITLDKDRVKSRVEQMCAGYENADEMAAMYLGNQQFMSQIEPMVIEEQAVDWIVEKGKKKTKKVGFQEYMKPVT